MINNISRSRFQRPDRFIPRFPNAQWRARFDSFNRFLMSNDDDDRAPVGQLQIRCERCFHFLENCHIALPVFQTSHHPLRSWTWNTPCGSSGWLVGRSGYLECVTYADATAAYRAERTRLGSLTGIMTSARSGNWSKMEIKCTILVWHCPAATVARGRGTGRWDWRGKLRWDWNCDSYCD